MVLFLPIHPQLIKRKVFQQKVLFKDLRPYLFKGLHWVSLWGNSYAANYVNALRNMIALHSLFPQANKSAYTHVANTTKTKMGQYCLQYMYAYFKYNSKS